MWSRQLPEFEHVSDSWSSSPVECRLDCRGHNQPVTGWANRHPVERSDQATTGRNVQGNVVLKGNRHEIFILSNPTDADDDDCSPSAWPIFPIPLSAHQSFIHPPGLPYSQSPTRPDRDWVRVRREWIPERNKSVGDGPQRLHCLAWQAGAEQTQATHVGPSGSQMLQQTQKVYLCSLRYFTSWAWSALCLGPV